MTPRRTTLLAALLGVLVVVAAAISSAPRFTGIRWVPTWHLTPHALPSPPAPTFATASSAPPASGHSGLHLDFGRIFLYLLIAAAAVLIGYLMFRWLSRRPPRSVAGMEAGPLGAAEDIFPEPAPEPEIEAPVVRRGVELALQLLDEEREPGDAILKAWLGLQQTAEESGITRRAAETPTEFTRRIMGRISADDRALKTLLNLYLRARFGEHPVIDADVARARDALQALARSWDDGASAGGSAGGGGLRPGAGRGAP